MPRVWHWKTAARAAEERWSSYCRRTAEESARIVGNMEVEQVVAPELRAHIFFNASFTEEGDAP